MGAIRGSLSFTRYFVKGDVPEDFARSALKRIRAKRFEELDPMADENERHGWCSIGDPMNVEPSNDDVFFNEYLCLGLRIDRWMVPKPLFLAHLRDAEAALLEKKGLEKLGRKAKADLKLQVMKKLRKQLVPTTKSIDLVWSLNAGVMRFFSTSGKVCLMAEELFEKTFELKLVPQGATTMADRLLTEAEVAVYDALEPTSLASGSAK